MTRLEKFRSYSTHAWHQKTFKKLKPAEIAVAEKFIADNDHLPKGDFELKLNRMFLGVADKPKNFPIILELLTCANSG
jgi:hypothetical protein